LTQYFTPVTAFAYLVFNLFIPPCFAAIGAMRAEMGSEKWLLRGLAFQFSAGYILAMLITQIGSLLVYGKPAVGFVPAVIILGIAAAYLIFIFKKVDSRSIGTNTGSNTFRIGVEN
jgi:ferrous iron transport protein B